MNYPSELKYSELETTSPEYKELLDSWNLIKNISQGGIYSARKAEDYLLIRDDEDPKITEKRKEKWFHRNHLSSAIRLQRTKMSTGNLQYPKEDVMPGDYDKWNSFFSNADSKHTDFKKLLLDIFEQALQYRTVFTVVDLPPLNVEASNARQHELAMKALQQRNQTNLPYIINLEPQNVLNWSESLEGLDWVKYKVILEETHPFKESTTSVMWVIIDDTNITVYGLDDIKLDKHGQVSQIKKPISANHTSENEVANILGKTNSPYKVFDSEEDLIPLIYSQPHQRGAIPVLKFDIPFSMWTTNQVLHVQKFLMGLDVNVAHTTINAGFIQKWLEPYLQSGSNAIQLPPEAMRRLMEEFSKTQGDESTLNVKSFNFAEMEGKSIKVQMEVINELTSYIYTTISTNVASVSKDVLEQSGRSKEFDMYLAEIALINYGDILVKFGEKLLHNVARAMGIQDPSLLENITLRGMNEFRINSLTETLERWGGAMEYDTLPLPPLLKKMIVQEVVMTATRNATDEEVDAINTQMDELYNNMPLQPPIVQ